MKRTNADVNNAICQLNGTFTLILEQARENAELAANKREIRMRRLEG